MASRAELEQQLADLEQAHQAQQIDDATYQQGRAHLMQQMDQARQSIAPGGSDFFSTGGGAPPTASGVRLDQPIQPVSAHGPISQGQIIRGRYRIDGLIGEGGMGVVYRVHDSLRERPLAMKLLHPHFPPEAQHQLASEISMQERIRHKGVVRTYDLDVDPESGRFFYTMEYVDGPSLEEQLEEAKQRGMVPPLYAEQIHDLLKRLTGVLHVAHQENIVHRDLKPQNILLPKRGGIKLLDFGIAKDLSEQSQHTGFTGTPIYMAPEQLRGGGSVTPAADIYSVGVMLYQFMTGQLFYGRMPGPMEWLEEQGHQPPFPHAVDDVVFKALDFSPERRYQSMPELLADFERAAGLAAPSAAAHGPIGSSPSRAKSWTEAALDADQNNVDEEVYEEPEVAAPGFRRGAPIKGRAPLSVKRNESGIRVTSKEDGFRKKKKKKRFGILKILLIVFFVIPTGLGVLSYFLVGSKVRNAVKDATTAATLARNVPPPKIDLGQVNEAFRNTTIPSHYGNLSSSYKRTKAWMFEFERAVNEIYNGSNIVWLHARRVGNKSIIRGYLNSNGLFGFQPGSDQLLFRIVQENSLAMSLTGLRALQQRMRNQAQRGSFLDDDAKDSIQKAKALLAGRKDPLKYRVEDGMGWVYLRDSLPVSAGFHALARLSYMASYYTMTSRKSSILTYRKTYRSTSAYRKRQSRYATFITTVKPKRTSYYRRYPYKLRSRYRSRYRSRSSYRSRYRSRGGKW